MKTLYTSFFSLLFLFISCNNDENSDKQEPKLLFKSGFESGVSILDFDEVNDDYRYIVGSDVAGFSWPINVLGNNVSESGLHYVHSDNNEALGSEIQTIIGHGGTETKALYNIEHYNVEYTQCPYEILDITDGRKDLYIKYWIKVDAESTSRPNMWRTFFEWKTLDYAEGDGFRLISYIYTDDDGVPYWHWQGDANPENPIWEIDNKEIPVPLNEWFLTEFYWHWSEGDNGRALWKINGQVVGDYYGATTRNSKPIDFIMLTQIYGNTNPKHQWIDDIEIWDGLVE
jgi:hypothetical protein